jgi:hypothetical protein
MKRNQMGSKTKNTGFGVGVCDIDFFNFHYCQVQNFESVRARPKFCSKLLKSPKAKAKVNKMQ